MTEDSKEQQGPEEQAKEQEPEALAAVPSDERTEAAEAETAKESKEAPEAEEGCSTEAVIVREADEDGAELTADLARESLRNALGAGFNLLRLVMLVVIVLMVAECVQYIEEGTVGVKKRFGRYIRDDQGRVVLYKPESQFVFVLPFPIEDLQIVSLKTETLEVRDNFWPAVDKVNAILDESILPKQKTLDPSKDGYNLTGDFNIIHSQWRIEYRVKDPVRYVSSVAGDRAEDMKKSMALVLKEITCGVIARNMAGVEVDAVLTGDLSGRLSRDIKKELSEGRGGRGWGIEVTAVNTRGIFPPGITQQSFNRVTGSFQQKKKQETEAMAFAGQLKSRAESEARKLILQAEVETRRTVEQAMADAAALEDLLEKFPNDPVGLSIFLEQRRQDWLAEIMQRSNLYVIPKGSKGVLRIAPSPEERASQTGGGQ